MTSVLTSDQLSKLKFINNQIYVVPKKHKVHLYHSISEESMDRMASLLQGRDAVSSISKGKKAYILPDSILSVDDWKVRLKENGYLIASSPKNADFIVGSDIRYDGVYDREFYMGSVQGEWLFDIDGDLIEDVKNYTAIQDIRYNDFFFNQDELVSKFAAIYYECQSRTKMHLVKDSIMEVVYWILAKSLPVITAEDMYESFDKLVIDQDMYESIKSMLHSSKADAQIAMNFLYNCDYVKSSYYIRKLSFECYNAIYNYLDHSRLSEKFSKYYSSIRYLDNNDYLTYLAQNDLLSEEIYSKAIHDHVRDRVYNLCCDSLTTVTINPAYSYVEFLEKSKNQEVIEI